MKRILLLLLTISSTLAFAQTPAQIDLPVTFDDTANVDYSLTDFGGNVSVQDAADPAGGTNLVAMSTKTNTAMTWAGTTMGPASGTGYATPVPFTATQTKMTVMVYSPDAGIPVRLKVEDSNDVTHTVETEAMTTMANTWEMLTFDFSNQAPGTAALNLTYIFDKASIFFNFGTDGATAGTKVYYWDDVEFVTGGGSSPGQIDLPVTFEDTATVDYSLTDFGGNNSMAAVADPAGGTNLVAMSTKTNTAMTWAGTTMGPASGTGFATAVPFTATETQMTVMVYSPDAGIPVRLKMEDANDNTHTVETEVMTTMANAWEMLTFDFSTPVTGTAALDLTYTYDKASLFFNFGTDGATAGTKVYYWDDVEFVGGGGTGGTNSPYCNTQVYHLGNTADVASSIYLTIKSTGPTTAEVEIESADADAVDFLLVLNGTGATISPEDFSVPGKIKRTLTWATAPANIELNVLWSKASFGGNWQLSPNDVSFPFNATCSGTTPVLTQIDLPVTFEDTATVDYSLTDFGGNNSMAAVADPAGGTNLVAMSTKTNTAMTWAGTTMGPASGTGFATAVPFTATETQMTVMVYSPDAGIPVRLKMEDANDNTHTVETEVMTTMANAWEMLTFDFSTPATGTAALDLTYTYDKASLFFNFGTDGATAGTKVYYWDDVEFVGGSGGPGLAQIDLPVTFEDTATVDYSLTDFGGNNSMPAVADPAGGTNLVAMSTKTNTAMTWAGTTMGPASGTGFATAVPFTATETQMTVMVYSPDAGIPVRLKVEDANDNTHTVETEVMTTMANAWEMLTFDFSMPATGTAALDLTYTYDKASIFFNFGTDGATAGTKVYYWDDVEFVGGSGGPGLAQIDLPVTFEDTATVDYSLTDFGGNASMSAVADPAGGTNLVAMSTKTNTAMTWAGTTMGPASGTGFATAVPFTATETKMTVRVYSPDAGIPVRLKMEDANDNTHTVETEVMTTMANAWEMLTFDFSMPATGTAALDLTYTYDKASLFFNFGTDGATAGTKVYYWDDVEFVGGSGGPGLAQIDLPVTFEDTATVDYSLTDFGGNASMPAVADPAGGTNLVAMSTKTNTAMTWAGTTMGPASGTGFATAIPFSATDTRMTVMVYSPDAGIPVRLKVEDSNDNTRSVETEAMTTMANAWEMLTFDFANPATGTAALNLTFTYDLASIFFNFGTDGATAGEKIYYWDDVEFVGGGGGPSLAQIDLPVTFEDTATVDYSLTDFGGNASMPAVADPAGGTNLVAMSTKTNTAMTWAGTTMGPASGTGFATAVPFTATETKMTVMVYSPDAGIPVRLKVEDANDNTHTVETEAMTTMANAWEMLTFDFSTPAAGTAALDLTFTYDKASLFFNFGTDGATAGEKIYYWDDVKFVGGVVSTLDQIDLPVTFEDTATVDYSLTDFGGNASMSAVADPAGGTNLVAMSTKTNTAMTWAGTTMGPASGTGFATAIPFSATDTRMTVMVYSPDAGIPVRLKAEDSNDNTRSVETEAMTTMANTWEMLTFDFANPAAGTAALNLTFTYDLASIFFNFGTDGATAGEKIYYWDDVEFVGGGGGPTLAQIDMPVTFEDTATVDYSLTDFGGTFSTSATADPAGGTNLVAMTTKSDVAMDWAGTTMGPASGTGFASSMPFTATETKVTVMVYSPDAGIPVRFKLEDSNDNTHTVETEAMTTTANAWEMLTFDFSMPVTGTAALDLTYTYDLASIFFNFGTDGATAGEKIYYWDDVEFGDGSVGLDDLQSVGFHYYPNPVQETLRLNADERIQEIRLYNMMGQELNVERPNEYQTTLDMSTLISGTYIVRVWAGDAFGTVRVVKQ